MCRFFIKFERPKKPQNKQDFYQKLCHGQFLGLWHTSMGRFGEKVGRRAFDSTFTSWVQKVFSKVKPWLVWLMEIIEEEYEQDYVIHIFCEHCCIFEEAAQLCLTLSFQYFQLFLIDLHIKYWWRFKMQKKGKKIKPKGSLTLRFFYSYEVQYCKTLKNHERLLRAARDAFSIKLLRKQYSI